MGKIGVFECAVCGYEQVHREEVNQSPECPECGGVRYSYHERPEMTVGAYEVTIREVTVRKVKVTKAELDHLYGKHDVHHARRWYEDCKAGIEGYPSDMGVETVRYPEDVRVGSSWEWAEGREVI